MAPPVARRCEALTWLWAVTLLTREVRRLRGGATLVLLWLGLSAARYGLTDRQPASSLTNCVSQPSRGWLGALFLFGLSMKVWLWPATK